MVVSDVSWKHRFFVHLDGLRRRTALYVKDVNFDIVTSAGHIEFYDLENVLVDLLDLSHVNLDMCIDFNDGQGECFRKFHFKEVKITSHCFVCDYTDPEVCTHKLLFSFRSVRPEEIK